MINFLHTFHPSPILISFGPIHIYWYGLFIVLGTLSALAVATHLAKFYDIKNNTIIDLALWLVVGGIIGARLYDIFLEWPYFSGHPLDIFKIWQGGLAIHGAIIGGLIALWLFTKKHQYNFWQLAAIIVTVLPLAQAIGRWGNYFNQELFGGPTNLPWGIPIDLAHRPWQYLSSDYFQPAFIYESLGNLTIFIILILLQFWLIKKQKFSTPPDASRVMHLPAGRQVMYYAILYSLLRFSTEFIRIDITPVILGWRLPQIASLFIVALCLAYLAVESIRKINSKSALEK